MKKFITKLLTWLSGKDDVKMETTYIVPSLCQHLAWGPETKENNWRSHCLGCNTPAAGSCQG